LIKRRDFLRAVAVATGVTGISVTTQAHDGEHSDDKPLANNLQELARMGLVFGTIDKKIKADSFVVNSLKADDILPSIAVQFNNATEWPNFDFRKFKKDASDFVRGEMVIVEGKYDGKVFIAERVLLPLIPFSMTIAQRVGKVVSSLKESLQLSSNAKSIEGYGSDNKPFKSKASELLSVNDTIEGYVIANPTDKQRHIVAYGVQNTP